MGKKKKKILKAKLVNKRREAQDLLRTIQGAEAIGFDTESSGPNLVGGTFLNVYKSTLAGFSIAVGEDAWYVPVGHKCGNLSTVWALQLITAVERHPRVWAHNWKHDLNALVPFIHRRPAVDGLEDSLLVAWLLGRESGTRSRYGLKALSLSYLDMRMASYESTAQGKPFGMLTPLQACKYAAEDAIATLRLGEMFWPELVSSGLLRVYEEQEKPLIAMLSEMEAYGVGIDRNVLLRVYKRYAPETKRLYDAWEKRYGCSIRSPKQLSDTMFPKPWPVDGVSRTSTGYSTSKSAMERFLLLGGEAAEAAQMRLDYQFYSKNLSTYTLNLIDWAQQYADGRLHPSFNQVGTSTGRLASNSPNAQNLPTRTDLGKKILAGFVAPAGRWLVSADFSQIELRVLAHFAGGALEEAYREGRDVHQQTADVIGRGCTRDQGKTINFSTIYGAGPRKLAEQLGVGAGEGREFLDAYWRGYPRVKAFREEVLYVAKTKGWAQTIAGRRRYFSAYYEKHTTPPNWMTWDEKKTYMKWERQAFNAVIQGSAADIVKRGMLNCRAAGLRVIAQIHDDVIIESDRPAEDAVVLRKALESSWDLKVPLVAEPSIGRSWAELKKE